MTRAAIPDGEVDEIRKRCDAATPGPWHVDKHDCYIWGPQGEMVADQDIANPDVKAVVRIRGAGASLPMSENMAFIANARTDIPFLLARLTALEAENAALKAEVAEAWAKAIEECAKAIPSSWLDSQLTGPNAVLKGNGDTWGCPDIERLLNAIRERIRSLSTSQGEQER